MFADTSRTIAEALHEKGRVDMINPRSAVTQYFATHVVVSIM